MALCMTQCHQIDFERIFFLLKTKMAFCSNVATNVDTRGEAKF